MESPSDFLAALRREYPGHRIDREPRGGSYRYAATALRLCTRPWCVVTHDFEELRSALAAIIPESRESAGAEALGADPEEYPQAIADEYPGWGVEHTDGRWTAWCPAITVHAESAARLRAAIEQAIIGDG